MVESGGYSPVAVHRLLIAVASLVAGHRLRALQQLGHRAPYLGLTGPRACRLQSP